MSKMSFTPAQEMAIHQSGTNLLVAAGAGSGKTRVLTERVLLRLQAGISINRLVILTFTNAAADEMKQRIKVAISGIPNLVSTIGQVDTAMISTFDAFALRIVKQYHYLLGLDREIDVVDNVILADLKKRCLEATLDRYYAMEDPTFVKVAVQLFDRGDELLSEAVRVLSNGLEMIADQQAKMDDLMHLTDDDRIDDLIKAFWDLCQKQLQDIRESFEKTLEAARQIDHEKVERFSNQICAQYDLLLASDSLETCFSILSSWKNPIFPRKSDDLPIEDLETLKTCYDRTKTLLKDLKDNFKKILCDSVSEMTDDIRRLSETIQVIVSITRDYLALLDEKKHEHGLFHFTDIMHLAIRLFQTHPALLAEFKSQIVEVMVDEYQDTNDLQEYLLQMISENNLFAVGDIKQSIYGFRNANPKNFLRKYVDYSQHLHGEAISLTDNFRSRKEVIGAINWLFSQVMDAEIGGIDYHDDQRLVAGNLAYDRFQKNGQSATPEFLCYAPLDAENQSASLRPHMEAKAIKNDIIAKIQSEYQVYDSRINALRTVDFGDFAIIVDRKNDFPIYQQALVSGQIPVAVQAETPFSASEEIVFLIQFCTLLKDLHDRQLSDSFRESLLGVCRSFVYQVPDDAIVNLFLDVALQTEAEIEYLKTRPAFQAILTDLEAIIPWLDTLPLTEILQKIYHQTQITSRISRLDNPEGRERKLDYLFQKVGMLSQMDFPRFCEYFDTIAALDDVDIDYTDAPKPNQTAVQLTTMHKSKGLEYAICYYPGLTKMFNYRENKQHFIFSRKYGFFAKPFHNGFKKTILHLLYENESFQDYVSERIRLLYVALTRAREKQVILMPQALLNDEIEYTKAPELIPLGYRRKLRSYGQLFSCLAIPDAWRKTANLEEGLSLEEKPAEVKKLPQIPFETFHFPIRQQQSQTYAKSADSLRTASENAAIQFGSELHEILQNFDFRHPSTELERLPERTRKLIAPLIHMAPLNNLENRTIHQEMSFLYETDGQKHQGVIDLLIVGSDAAWIIDFKLKKINDPAYIRQCDGYRAYVEAMTGKPVTTYLYSLIEQTLYPIGGPADEDIAQR